MVDVAANYREILERIAAAAAKSARDPKQIKVLGAAKEQNVELVRAAIAAGVGLIGENYVQEAQEKMESIQESVEWHMIGHLQRNKAKAAVELFDVIESLDNLPLARVLDKEGGKRGKTVRAFVEVNLGGEESKTGMDKGEVVSLFEEMRKLSHLRIEGLMTVPPFKENPDDMRPYFRELRELQAKLRELRIPNADLKELSMGMTHDFPVAVEEGATIVRIGTALFGPRSR